MIKGYQILQSIPNVILFGIYSVQSEKIKQHKKRVNYTINKHTIDRFKQLCQKRGWIMSIVVENNIKRVVNNT